MDITLDYAVDAIPRYGWGKEAHPELNQIFQDRRARFVEHLETFASWRDSFLDISLLEKPKEPHLPYWNNGYFPGLDAISLSCFIRMYSPRTFCEIGSGHSTRFARNAIDKASLDAQLISIDPHPRAEIDIICDEVVRRPLEQVDPEFFAVLQAGDILFLDSSHRSFMNSDVTAFFLDILPKLQSGVLIHLHDIFLPYDYPHEWRDRFYNEQYLLACTLLANSGQYEIEMSSVFVNFDEELQSLVDVIFDDPGFSEVLENGWIPQSGWSFWMRKL